MSAENIAISLSESYGINPSIAEEVSELADSQRHDYASYGDFFTQMGIPDSEVVDYDGYKPMEVLDVPARSGETRSNLLVHTAMGGVFDNNFIYQIATISNLLPDTRIIAAANTGALGVSGSRALTRAQRRRVASGDFSPVADPFLKYVDESGVETAMHYGYSYGVEVAASAVARADHDVESVLLLDTATAHKWQRKMPLLGLGQLGLAFMGAAEPMEGYVETCATPNFDEARADSAGLIMYSLGLVRPSNIAISRGLTTGGFVTRVTSALEHRNQTHLTVAWGTESEFNVAGATTRAVDVLVDRFGTDQVTAHPLEGHKHAVANNIYFQSALIKQALEHSSSE